MGVNAPSIRRNLSDRVLPATDYIPKLFAIRDAAGKSTTIAQDRNRRKSSAAHSRPFQCCQLKKRRCESTETTRDETGCVILNGPEDRGVALSTEVRTYNICSQKSCQHCGSVIPSISSGRRRSHIKEPIILGPTNEQVEAGQRIYTKTTLLSYDFVVLFLSCRFIWRCPAPRIEEHYNKHVTGNHLDVGVGTGYFLDRCRFPSRTPRIALLDLNQNSLEHASLRIARYNPEVYCRNILEPVSVDAGKFDSVGINGVLHCIPGAIDSKAIVLTHLKALMNPNAVLFGMTLLHGGVPRSWPAKRLMQAYNKMGIFSNSHDDLDGLSRALSERFRTVSVEIVGCAALFSGRV